MIKIGEKQVLTKNCNFSVEELDAFTKRLKATTKKSVIAGSFSTILDLNEEKLKHFKSAPYIWRPVNGNIYGGMLADETLDYIHIVMVSEEVLEYILKL